MKLSKLGFGTAAIGRPMYINIKNKKTTTFDYNKFMAQAKTMLDYAYDNGIRYFDTAPGYGLSESLLISWLSLKNDPSIEIATKWGYEYTANFNLNPKTHEKKEHSINMLNKQWGVSKTLLPYLSTYQIHSATFESGVLENKEVLKQLNNLKKEGGVKIGLTTSGYNQTAVLKEALKNELFEVFQVTYNIFDQSLLKFISEHNTTDKKIVLKECLGNGRVFRNQNYPHYEVIYNRLETLATKYNVGVDAIAYQFCEQTVPNKKILSGASEIIQLKENLQVVNLILSESEIVSLKQLAVSPKKYWMERKQLDWQ